MTVSSTNPTISYQYTGPGVYSFPFLTYREDDIEVVYSNDNGISRVLDTSEYIVIITDGTDGGSVTTSSPLDTEGLLIIRRILPIEQQVDWVNNDPLDADILERSFDRLVMMIQQLQVLLQQGAAVLSWRGFWQPDTLYIPKDMVVHPDNGNWYYAINEHISSSSLDDDIDAGYWILALDIQQLEDLVAQAAQSEANARLSAENAEASEDAAAISEANASDSETNAGMSEINAANCAAEAYQSEQLARQYRDEAAAIVAAGKVVEVVNENYHTATASQVTFPINPPTPERFLLVFMNSRKLRLGEDFTTDLPSLASNVVLTSPAVSGDEIDITLFNSIDGSA